MDRGRKSEEKTFNYDVLIINKNKLKKKGEYINAY